VNQAVFVSHQGQIFAVRKTFQFVLADFLLLQMRSD